MKLIIVIKHVFVGILVLMDETTIKANIPLVKQQKSRVNSKWRQIQRKEKEKKMRPSDEPTTP
jgi:hypothetical protein